MGKYKNAVSWIGKEVARTILAPLGMWLLGILFFLLPSLILWLKTGFSFQVREHLLPGWAISFGFGTILLFGFVIVRQQIRIGALKPEKGKTYTRRGFEWILTSEFWFNYGYWSADEMSEGLLASCVRGPFCEGCKRDVSPLLAIATRSRTFYRKCPDCNHSFDIKGIENAFNPVVVLRKEAYREAQGEARRGETR